MMPPQKTTVNTLDLRGVGKTYGRHQVIQALDLSIGVGESLAIIGHNGAGKTTLIKLLLGLTRPSCGSIHLWGQAIDSGRYQQARDAVGFLPETVSFHPGMSGRQMLRFYARLKGEPLHQCDQLLELLGLGAAADRLIRTYSKGMRQRLGLAQALLGSPRLLLLDEPTSGLDPFLRTHFYEIISERQAAGTTILVSSHALTEIEAQTDRIAIMEQGRIIIDGTLEQLRSAAGLPVHITVTSLPQQRDTLLQALAGQHDCREIGTQELEFSCDNADKIALLHRITRQQDLIEDIRISPPRLNELYAHFVTVDSER